MQALRARFAQRVGCSQETDNLTLTRRVADGLTRVDGVNAEAEDFILSEAFERLGITPQSRVYVNWYRFDDVDRISLNNLSSYFTDIWYPGTDDIEIFDETCCWILSISHDGDLSYGSWKDGADRSSGN